MIHNRVAGYESSAPRRPAPGLTEPDWQVVARERGREAYSQFEQFLSANPKACLGIGLALGVILGWFVKRR